MITVSERLNKLRAAMAGCGCDAFLMPSSDPHASEYAPAHYTSWEYFGGFTCENATLIVTRDEAALWVDGRFFGAADAALEGTGVQSMHMGVKGVPTREEWLLSHLAEGQTVGYSAPSITMDSLNKLESSLSLKGIVMKDARCDDMAWTEDRPALPCTPAWILEEKYAGCSIEEKLRLFHEKLGDCNAAVLTKLDSIAWLLNLRAGDVANTPYAIAFCFVTETGAVLFTEESRVRPEALAELQRNGVTLQGYNAVASYIRGIGEDVNVLIDPKQLNAELFNALMENDHCTLTEGNDPVQLLKAVKNAGEIECTKEAHLADAVAMVRFEIELEQRLAAGESLRETDIDPILHKYRSAAPLFIDESFGTIAAYGANAAMMHYAPEQGSDAAIERRGFLLVDCGGTYYNGTTDITRTYTVGPMTEQEKEMYTLTLQSHIDMAMAVWRTGMTGRQLDMLARAPFWRRKLDYRCGTGHSVSHVGSVHEGPHSLNTVNTVEFVPGMVVTDEPGYYEETVMGMRIENELVCVSAGESEYGEYLKFEPLTFVPINTQPVISSMLSCEELAWLNAYHAEVCAKLKSRLTEEEYAWLEAKCRPIG